jgi:polysaccharide biosynthesis transport protein
MEFVFDMREFFKVLLKNWRIIIFLTLFIVLISVIVSMFVIPPTYEARVNILVTAEKAQKENIVTSSEIDSSLKLIETYRVIIKSPTILEPAIKKLNRNIKVDKLLDKIEIESIKDSQVFTIVVVDNSPVQAVSMANSIAIVFQEEVARLKNLNYIHILTPAKIDDLNSPINRNPIFNVAISLFFGLFLSIGSITIKEYLDTTLKSEEKIKRLFSLSVLGEVTPFHKKGKKHSASEHNDINEKLVDNRRAPNFSNYQNICARLKLSPSFKGNKTLLITSPDVAEGKSITSVNLAIMMAKSMKKTVYIDMNLRGPVGHLAFNLPNDNGVSSFLVGDDALEDIIHGSDIPNLSVITSGSITTNPIELFESEKFQQLFIKLRSMFDMIVIDSPSMCMADTLYISSEADGSVLVVNPNKTLVQSTQKAVEKLNGIQANLLGVVINNDDKK